MSSVSDFKSNFKALYRPNQFKVTLRFPEPLILNPDPSAPEKLSEFFVRAAEIPGSSVGSVAVPFRGRMVKYAGDRTFTPWTVTVMNDDGFEIRDALESWMNNLDNHSTGCATADGIRPNLYQTTMEVAQYSKNCEESPIRIWKFQNAFPIELSPIALDYQSNDTIEEYTVTFDYDFWTSENTI